MRILLSAYACAPDRGSEPGIGWNWACLLSRRHQVHVLTAAWSEPLIRRELQQRPRPNLHFHFVPDLASGTSRWPLGLGWAHQYLWQYRAYRVARGLHAQFDFDLAHHVSYSTWRVPSLLVRLGIPFIWGPIGGEQRIPPGFMREFGHHGVLRETIRGFAQTLCRFDPLIRRTLSQAAVVLAANSATRQFLSPLRPQGVGLMLETAAPAVLQEAQPRPTRRPGQPFRLLWVGQMVPAKALPLLLKALRRLGRDVAVHVDIVGDGPRRRAWQRLADKLGVSDRLQFHGQLPFRQTLDFFRQSDALVFTSLRDTSGNVVLEAMSAALPVICLDWSGPHDLTSDRCAIRIRPQSPAQVVEELARAIAQLAADPQRCRRMGLAGRTRANELFTWEKHGSDIESVYAEAMRSLPDGAALAWVDTL